MDSNPKGRTLALVGYGSSVFIFIHLMPFIAILGAVILYNLNKNQPFAAFHHRQMLGIACIAFLITAFTGILQDSWIAVVLLLLIFAMVILGFIDAYKNQTTPLPLIGSKFQEWFTFIK